MIQRHKFEKATSPQEKQAAAKQINVLLNVNFIFLRICYLNNYNCCHFEYKTCWFRDFSISLCTDQIITSTFVKNTELERVVHTL